MTAREKAAASGLAVTLEQAKLADISREIDWKTDCAWHCRVGNGQQLQNVGLVLLTVFASLSLKTGKAVLLTIEPPSQPEGLKILADKTLSLDVEGLKFKYTSHEDAMEAHSRVHDAGHCGGLLQGTY